MNNKIVISLISLLFVFSCTKNENSERILNRENVVSKIQEFEPQAKIVLPSDMSAGINCIEFEPNCVSGHLMNVLGLEISIIEFANHKDAKKTARKINGLVYENWVLDDVVGEPILEDFFKKKLNASHP